MIGKAIMGFLRWLQDSYREQGALVVAQPSDEIQPEEKQVENGATASDGVSPAPAILEHRFIDVRFAPTNNMGGRLNPQYLIMHYTANNSVASTVKWFQKNGSDASAHLIIGRDGEAVQMVPFDRIAWHAGQSQWAGLVGMNRFSIGIEMVNWGPLTYRNGKLLSWAGEMVEYEDAQQAPGKDGKLRWWHKYTPEQMEVAHNVAIELFRYYNLIDVLGHWEIAIPKGRKEDPGPLFPLEKFRP